MLGGSYASNRFRAAEALASPIHEVHAKTADQEPKEEAERGPRHLVCDVGATSRAHEHGGGENDGRPHVNVAVPVIFECGGETDGRKQYRKGRSRGHMLRETGPIDQRRYDDDAATDAEETRRDAAENADHHEGEPWRHLGSPVERGRGTKLPDAASCCE